ncbi:MAG: transposase [bacterium]
MNSKESWSATIKKLKSRSIQEVWLIISDVHKYIWAAIIRVSWAIMKTVQNSFYKKPSSTYLPQRKKAIYSNNTNRYSYSLILKVHIDSLLLVEKYHNRYPEAIECLSETLEDSL